MSWQNLLPRHWITILALVTPAFPFVVIPIGRSLKLKSVATLIKFTNNDCTDTELLFAWITQAIKGDDRYDDLDVAMAAIFDEQISEDSEPLQLLREISATCPIKDDEQCGSAISLQDRELNSLGPIGAGQWSGQTEAFPHSLLLVKNFSDIGEWEKSLPRKCRQTLRKTQNAHRNITVEIHPITGGLAPHSTLAHFRCVVEHQVRLQEMVPGGYFIALCEAVGRYVATTRMAGTIYEYRNEHGDVLAFSHEIRKGRTVRGQWFYATNEASRKYVWFHCVYSLVERAFQEKGKIDVVDLGPNGLDGQLDAHAELKRRYGFHLVEHWPKIADYRGAFW